MSKPAILTLSACKTMRQKPHISITDKELAKLARLPLDRVKVLESRSKDVAEEPWLDEAEKIGRVLGMGVCELIDTPCSRIDELDTGFDAQDAIAVWRTGARLPLRFGIRLAVLFGMDDPFELLRITPTHKRIWATLEKGERLGEPGICPYCAAAIVGGAGHFPSCLPSILWGPRDQHLSTIGVRPHPLKPHVRRGGSHLAPGLKPLRERLGLTQEEMARSLGIALSTYYRVEKLHDKLTQVLAEKVALTYGVTVPDLWGVPDQPPAPIVSDHPTVSQGAGA